MSFGGYICEYTINYINGWYGVHLENMALAQTYHVHGIWQLIFKQRCCSKANQESWFLVLLVDLELFSIVPSIYVYIYIYIIHICIYLYEYIV